MTRATTLCLMIAANLAWGGGDARGAEKQPPVIPEVGRFKEISNADLLREYERAGLALRGTLDIVTDQPISRPVAGAASGYRYFQRVRAEIIRRGTAIVPDLLEFLRQEIPKQRPKEANSVAPGFSSDVIEMLVAIADSRAAGVLVDILGGEGHPNRDHTYAALGGLERITFCSFYKVDPHHRLFQDTVEHAAAALPDNAPPDQAALLYRIWLSGEGKDPSRWLPLARQRARQILAANDLSRIYCVAVFLRPYRDPWYRLHETGRDDRPNETLARLGEIVGQFKKAGSSYRWRSQDIPQASGNWICLLADYGPMARPYAETLIRLQEESGLDDWGGIERLRLVGGEKIMAFFFRCLPSVKNDSVTRCRGGIDRWAGRVFTDDAARLKWWEANHEKSQEAWLAEGLSVAAAQADAGYHEARQILAEIVPAIWQAGPSDDGLEAVLPKDRWPPSCSDWVKTHKTDLLYDEQLGGFRLRKIPE